MAQLAEVAGLKQSAMVVAAISRHARGLLATLARVFLKGRTRLQARAARACALQARAARACAADARAVSHPRPRG
jgi:hypothetical protein